MDIHWEDIGWGSFSLVLTILLTTLLFQVFRNIRFLQYFVSRHNHVFQLVLTLVFFVGLMISIYLAFGISMVSSLLSGLGIALGLALQPIMKKMVAGIVFDTTIQSGCRIECDKYIGKVTQVGMVHTWVDLDKGGKACIHNDYFNTHPITILKESTSEAEEVDFAALRYW